MRLALHPDDGTVFSLGEDRTIRAWNLATAESRQSLRFDGECEVHDMAVDPTGKRAALAQEDGTVSYWDLADGHPIRRFSAHPTSVEAVSLQPRRGRPGHRRQGGRSSSGPRPPTGTSESFEVTRRRSFAWRSTLAGICWRRPTSPAVSSSGRWRPGNSSVNLSGESSLVRKLAFSPDGTELAACRHDGLVKIWDVKTGVARFATLASGPTSCSAWHGLLTGRSWPRAV